MVFSRLNWLPSPVYERMSIIEIWTVKSIFQKKDKIFIKLKKKIPRSRNWVRIERVRITEALIYLFFCPPYKSWTCIKVFISNKNLSLPFFVILSAHLDLPTQSTLLYNATKILIRWEQLLVASLDSYTVEETLINAYPPSSTGEGGGVMRGGLTLQKTKLLLDPDNTPFRFVIISLIIAVFFSQSKKPTLTLLQ